jgi:hypothetical protein
MSKAKAPTKVEAFAFKWWDLSVKIREIRRKSRYPFAAAYLSAPIKCSET